MCPKTFCSTRLSGGWHHLNHGSSVSLQHICSSLFISSGFDSHVISKKKKKKISCLTSQRDLDSRTACDMSATSMLVCQSLQKKTMRLSVSRTEFTEHFWCCYIYTITVVDDLGHHHSLELRLFRWLTVQDTKNCDVKKAKWSKFPWLDIKCMVIKKYLNSCPILID